MAELKNKGDNKAKLLKVILPAAALVVVIAVLAGLVIVKNTGGDSEPESETGNESQTKIGYEANVIVSQDDDIQGVVDDMYKKAEEGNMALEFKTTAYSSDGENFSGYIANAISNSYDMFLAIYEDSTYENELYLTGLIPTGSAIDSFKLSKKLDKGEYNTVLVFTQVEDDHATIHAQVAVALTLIVK